MAVAENQQIFEIEEALGLDQPFVLSQPRWETIPQPLPETEADKEAAVYDLG
jgi:hypothetical protein